MSFVSWLFESTPDETADAPLRRDLHVPATERTEHFADVTEEPTPLEEVFVVMEYESAEGELTRRRVTFRSIRMGEQSALLQAICHERKAVRTFRCDRIRAFIDADGEVLPPAMFFREVLAIDIEAALARVKENSRARRLLDHVRPEVTVLVAAALADGELHANEIAVICEYVKRETAALPDFGAADHFNISDLVARLRPMRESLAEHLHQISKREPDRQQRFTKALKRVIAADGIETIAEMEFLQAIDLELLKLHRDVPPRRT